MTGLLVLYDQGAVHPVEVAQACAGSFDVTFAVADSDHARRLTPVMQSLGRVVALEAVLAGGGDVEVAGVVTFSESLVRAASRVAESLGLRSPGPAATEALTDKLRQREALRDGGVEVPAFASLNDGAAAALRVTGVPAVLKPRHGGGSRDIHLVRDARGLADLMRGKDPDEFLLEAYLPDRTDGQDVVGSYVSVESAVRDGVVTHFGVTGKFATAPPFREVGQFWPSALPADVHAEAMRVAATAIGALGIVTGITHTEIKLIPDGLRVLEVNGRLGGHIAELARRAASTDLVRFACEIAAGTAADVRLLSECRDVVWQVNTPSPRTSCRFEKGPEWRALKELDGVQRYVPYLRSGDSVEGGVGSSPLDVVCGVAKNHDVMRSQVTELWPRMSYEFSDLAGRRWNTTAMSLVGRVAS
jgi:hypothetical protein